MSIANFILKFLPFVWIISLLVHSQAEAKVIVYAQPVSHNITDNRANYPIVLLQQALAKLEKPYTLRLHRLPMSQSRAFKSLRENGELDIVWSMTSREREENYQPIRIPIYKGLIGLRLPLVLIDNQNQFQKTATNSQLSKFIVGQGHDWPDTEILRANGFTVLGPSTYDGLFGMLQKGRIDYFPRSVVEIWDELSSYEGANITIDKHIALYYPTAMYYFVKKNDLILFRDIKRALELSIQNGSFDELFLSAHKPLIEQANLSKRKVFRLNNPILPKQTPLQGKDFWYPIPSNQK